MAGKNGARTDDPRLTDVAILRLCGRGKQVHNAVMDRRAIEACLPAKLHSFSRRVLEIYLAGDMSTEEFRRWFHMPNSDYLPVSDCIAHLVDPYYIPESERAGASFIKSSNRT
jgi:hypothetical protein